MINLTSYQSGVFRKHINYTCFFPTTIDDQWEWADTTLNFAITEASRLLGEMNAFAQYVPDIDYFVLMHVAKEATVSSKIEGTQTTLEESLMEEAEVNPERRDDWKEVNNYIEAMNYAIGRLGSLPISSRLIREIHERLMEGVRGENKTPGEYRRSQNWIGGATINDARFVPPPSDDAQVLMGDLEKFLNNEAVILPGIVRIAIAHYQFETIHPFLDGNGRTGRLLIPIYLVSTGLLSRPTLYLSAFFEKHKALYYDNLMRVRTHHDMTHWLKFFMEGVIETCKNSIDTFKSILQIKEEVEGQKILQLSSRQIPKAKDLVRHLYQNPYITPQKARDLLGVTEPTSNQLIEAFVKLGILEEITGWKRNRKYVFRKYLDLFL